MALTCEGRARHESQGSAGTLIASGARRWPKRLGKYDLVRYLNAGGMGIVFEGTSRVSGLAVAVKFMDPDAVYPQKEERFSREIIALRLLRHEHVVRLMDFGHTEDGLRYLVMEYVSGWTLSELIARQGALSARRALAILRQLCGALAEAHALGIAHRDLKPSNVMLQARLQAGDRIKLIDFGLARLPGTCAEHARGSPGLFVGTPGYAPPEAWANANACGARGDVYGIGLIARHLLTGAPPPDLVDAAAHDRCRLVDELGRCTPAWLVHIVARCLAIEPEGRFADASEVLRALPATWPSA